MCATDPSYACCQIQVVLSYKRPTDRDDLGALQAEVIEMVMVSKPSSTLFITSLL